jgi:hypothetical protein
MARRLLTLSDERLQAERRKVQQADADEAVYVRRRNVYAAVAVLVWFVGVVLLGGAFHTTSMEVGAVLLLLGPLVGTFGPIAVAYVFWVTSGEL